MERKRGRLWTDGITRKTGRNRIANKDVKQEWKVIDVVNFVSKKKLKGCTK